MKRQIRSLAIATAFGAFVVLPAAAPADDLTRHDVDTAAAMDHIDIAYGRIPDAGSTRRHRWVVAGRDANSNLRIRGYAFSDNTLDNIDNDWSTSAGEVTQVMVAWVGAHSYTGEDDRFITAVRDSDGKLRLISWRYGQVARLDTATYLPTIKNSQIGIATLFNGYLVTAARELDDDIRLDLWRVTNSGVIVHNASTIAGRGSFANVVDAQGRRVVAAFRDENGQLSTQMFSIDAQYGSFGWSSGWLSSQAGKVRARSYNDKRIVATFLTSSNTLGVYFYDTENSITWLGGNIQSGNATGTITDLSVNSTGKVTTAVVQPSGDLKVIRWNLVNVDEVERDTDNVASGYPEGAASYPAVEGGSGAGADVNTYDQLLTAVRDASGDLRLTVWESN